MSSQTETSHQWLPFLLEARKHLLWLLGIWFLIACITIPFAPKLYPYFVSPVTRHLAHHQLIATTLTAPLLAPISMGFWIATWLTLPLILYKGTQFVKPALHIKEQHHLMYFTIMGTSLFYVGMLFGYEIVLPIFMHMLFRFIPSNIWLIPDITHTLSFIWRWLFAFGIAFEIPLLIFYLCKFHIVEVHTLRSYRAYWIIGSFILGMWVAPDVLGQLLFALPLCGLFEIGVWIGNKAIKT